MNSTSSTFRHTDELLLDREIAALRLVILFRLAFLLISGISTLTIGKSISEKLIVSTLCLIAIGTTVPFWLALNRRKWVSSIGLIGSGFDVVFLVLLPFIWYFAVGGPDLVSPAYMLKHPNQIVLSYIMLLVHSLAGRPRYPMILAVGVTTGALLTFGYSFGDSRLIFSPDFVTHILGTTVSLEFWVMNTITFAGIGLLLSWHVGRTSQSIRRAVRQETDNLLLSRYFSPAIQQEILNQNPVDAEGNHTAFTGNGSRKNIAVMFSDLRGFTSMAETLPPEEATRWLREYHEVMVQIIFEFEGTLDKFLGDGILATFGTPEPTADCAERAVLAALKMRTAIVQLNETRVARGLPALRQGIGIHYGPVIVGNVGVPERLEYTVIGDTVNLASRIEGMCKELQADLLISNEVTKQLKSGGDQMAHNRFESLGPQTIRGRKQSVELFKALD